MWGGGLNYFFGDILGLNFVQEEKKNGSITSLSVFLLPAFLWQLMRTSILQLLKNLRSHSKEKEITDADILIWANNKVKESGKTSHIESFKVHRPTFTILAKLSYPVMCITLSCPIDSLGQNNSRWGVLSWAPKCCAEQGCWLEHGEEGGGWFVSISCIYCVILWIFRSTMSFAFMVAEDERKLNATYIISVARKLGCTVFLLPENKGMLY